MRRYQAFARVQVLTQMQPKLCTAIWAWMGTENHILNRNAVRFPPPHVERLKHHLVGSLKTVNLRYISGQMQINA